MDEIKFSSIIYSSYNQDGSCFYIGKKDGFIIYNKNPKNGFYEKKLKYSVYLLTMLDKTNILGIVREDEKNKMILYDSNKEKIIKEIKVDFEIKNIKLKKLYIYIIGVKEIKIFDYNEFKKIETLKTDNNINGTIGISYDPNSNIIVYPSGGIGKVIIKNYNEINNNKFIQGPITLHKNNIYLLAMDKMGKYFSSCSENGNRISVWRTENISKLYEFKRSCINACINSLSFSKNSNFLLCASNSTSIINIFKINDENCQNNNSFNFIRSLNNFIYSDFARFSIDKIDKLVCFDPEIENGISVFTKNGKYLYITFNTEKGGECTKEIEEDY